MLHVRGMCVAVAALTALPSCLLSPEFFGAGGGTGGDAGRLGGGAGGGTAGGRMGGGPGGSGAGGGGTAGHGGGPPDAGFVMVRASRSSSIALLRGFRVSVNPDLPGLAVEGTTFPLFPSLSEPSALASLPNGDLVVTLRHAQELAYVSGLPSAPTVSWRVRVCSEPAGVAVSPSGRTAVVACLGDKVAVFVDTTTHDVRHVPLTGVARAVAVTNDGDLDDSDERAYVPLFFGIPLQEGSDVGRVGRVIEIDLGSAQVRRAIDLAPLAQIVSEPIAPGPPPPCAPNQLHAIAIASGRAWVSHSCVAPQAPLHKFLSVGSAISVIDLASGTELTHESTTLGRIVGQTGHPTASLLGVPIDLDVDPRGNMLVVLSQAANRVLPLIVRPGAPAVPAFPGMQMSLSLFGNGPCAYPSPCFDGGIGLLDGGLPDGVPIGLVLADDGGIVANDWTGRQVVDVFFDGRVASRRYAPPPPGNSRERLELMGKKFFFTGLGRWSDRDVGSCGSCHPDGLTDNVTWIFGSGPRQTPSLDGTFAKGDPTDHRAQNWTAIFDEIYDVEGVIRNVLGGRGALVTASDTPISLSTGITLDGGAYHRNDGLSGSTKSVNDALSVIHDWAEVDAYAMTVRPNRAPVWVASPGGALRGRAVFAQAGCAKCHGGPKWTVSRVPYDPSPQKNGSLPGDNNLPVFSTGLRTELRDGGTWAGVNHDTLKVDIERVAIGDGGLMMLVGPERITCVLRDVGTFEATNPLERKADGTTAQGALGFNPPSLFGLATSAPYFHHGEARTLEDVFAPPYARHHQAGAPGWVPTPQEISDLVAFLESIDLTTPTFPKSELVDLCGGY